MPEEPKSDEIKDEEEYEELREQEGVSKEEAARKADTESEEAEEEDSPTYEKWTDAELEKKAEEEGIDDYAEMDREHLIGVLRDKETQTM